MLFWLTLPFLFSQIFAGIAIISDFLSFQFKERNKIIVFFLISVSFLFLHYLLLDRYTAAVIMAIGIVRYLVCFRYTQKYWKYIFIAGYIIATIIFYKDVYDLIFLVGMSLSTFAAFEIDDKSLRHYMMSATSFSILYNFLIFSPMWVLLEGLFLWSNFIWYYRHYLKKKKKD